MTLSSYPDDYFIGEPYRPMPPEPPSSSIPGKDQFLVDVVTERLGRDPRTYDQDITVEVQNQVVILTGTVDSAIVIAVAGDCAWHAPGVRDVCNSLWLSERRGRSGRPAQ